MRIIKRVRQFHRALFSKMENADRELVNQCLDQKQKELFYRMDPSVQKHCVNVTREILASANTTHDNSYLIQAALLHDIGKLKGSFGLFHRVFYVLLTRISLSLVRGMAASEKDGFLGSMRYAFYVHLNHEALGAALAEQKGLPRDIVYLIANHHNKVAAGHSPELSALLAADELN